MTHSSESGPHRSGPIGTIATSAPACGEKIHRMSTSGSLAQREKSAETCSVAVCVTTPSPSYSTPMRPATRRPPSAPSR